MISTYRYPFAAVVGNNDAKEALLIALVNPKVGGVLISGEKATAKTTLIRSVYALTSMRIIELPLSATEDRIFGHIDLEKHWQTDKKCCHQDYWRRHIIIFYILTK